MTPKTVACRAQLGSDNHLADTSRQVCVWLMLAIAVLITSTGLAAEPSDFLPPSDHHSLLSADLPAGEVGRSRLGLKGPVANYFQPVAFGGPEGTTFALAQPGMVGQGEEKLMAGMLIGAVYRFRITNIPEAPGAELYPTVEIIDRTYPPEGLATSYPIPINVDLEDLESAMQGRLVTRVVYLEDPQTSLPLAQKSTETHVMDISESQDALHVADRFGRPVAIVRIGSVAPPRADALLPQFYFGYPTWAPIYQTDQ